MFNSRGYNVGRSPGSPKGIRHSRNRHVTGLGATSGEYHLARLSANKFGHLISCILNYSSSIASGLVHATGVAHDAVLKWRHDFGYFVSAWSRGGVIKVIEGHATK
jgi:hypothetical protein